MSRFAFLLSYSFKAVLKNWKAVVVFALFLIVSSLFSFIPLFSLPFSLFIALLGIQLTVYYGRPVRAGLSKEELLSFLENSTVKEIFTEKIEVSAGIFLGLFTIFFLSVAVFIGLHLLLGIPLIVETEVPPNIAFKLAFIYLLLFLFGSFLSYLSPLVFGYAIGKEDFGEAFLAVFRFFSPSFWRASLSLKYFGLVLIFSLVFIVLIILSLLLMLSVVLFPLGAMLQYQANVLFGAVSGESYRMVMQEE